MFFVLTVSCSSNKKSNQTQKIFYVNSYHPGYGSSDDVMNGITKTMEGKTIELKNFFMDSKRKSTETEIKESVQNALTEIDEFSPDLLIVSDDNAVKYLVQPYFNNVEMPVVFCGVNWSAKQYSLGKNITGMLEVLPLRELLSEIKSNLPEIKKLVVLSENSLSEQNNKTILDTLYENLGLEVEYSLTNDFSEWKQMFSKANKTADIIYLPTNGAIKNWNDEEAEMWVKKNLKVPVVTCDDFMMPYCVFGLTKVAKEQGEWAAQTALEILDGKHPSEISYKKNIQTKAWLNVKLAEKINFRISEEIKQNCTQL
jgi:ABC-type uncharacterized transport system substrate-binding protein